MKKCSAMNTFIQNVQRIRRERNITQTQLAEVLGTKQSAVSRVLRGDEELTLSRAERWAEALGVELADLVLQPEFSK